MGGSGAVNIEYRFGLDTQSNFNLNLNGLSQDVNVSLGQLTQNSDGTTTFTLIDGSYNPGTVAETITQRLAPGTYAVRIGSPSNEASTNFNLTLSAGAATSSTINGYDISGQFYSAYWDNRATLGDPLENAQTYSSTVSYQRFEGGSLVSTPTGTFILYGDIRQTYLNNGGLGGRLGVPTSDPMDQGNGTLKQTFQNGYIFWNGFQTSVYQTGNNLPPSSTSGASTYGQPNISPIATTITPVSFLPASVSNFRQGIDSGIQVRTDDPTNIPPGLVWTYIRPQVANVNRRHLVTINWGQYTWQGVVTLPEDGIVLQYNRSSVESIPRIVTVSIYDDDLNNPTVDQHDAVSLYKRSLGDQTTASIQVINSTSINNAWNKAVLKDINGTGVFTNDPIISGSAWYRTITGNKSANLTPSNSYYASNENVLWENNYAPNAFYPQGSSRGLDSGSPKTYGNCTWYANGRLLELGYDPNIVRKFSRAAGMWLGIAQSEAKRQANTGTPVTISNSLDDTNFSPQPGDIAEYQYGHVAIVEAVDPDGGIILSESSYGTGAANYLYRTFKVFRTQTNVGERGGYPDRFIRLPLPTVLIPV